MNVERIALFVGDPAGKDDRLLLRWEYFGRSFRADLADGPITSTPLDYLLNGPKITRAGNLAHDINCRVAPELRNRASEVPIQRITALLANFAGLAAVTRIECLGLHNLTKPRCHPTILHPFVPGRNTTVDCVTGMLLQVRAQRSGACKSIFSV